MIQKRYFVLPALLVASLAALAVFPQHNSMPSSSAERAAVIARAQRTAASPITTGALPSGPALNMTDGATEENAVRFIVRSHQTVTLGAELNARITQMNLREGDRFLAGETLVAFDCARVDAELASARSVLDVHRNAYATTTAMQRYQAAGSLAVEQARFEMQKAEADVRNIEAKRTTCTIAAPFNGRVVEKLAHAFEIAAPNQPLMKIVDDSKLELVLVVPSNWLSWLKPGSQFDLRIDETGERYGAVVAQIGGGIDPVSQTVRLIGEIERPNELVLAGMSGAATFLQARASK